MIDIHFLNHLKVIRAIKEYNLSPSKNIKTSDNTIFINVLLENFHFVSENDHFKRGGPEFRELSLKYFNAFCQ